MAVDRADEGDMVRRPADSPADTPAEATGRPDGAAEGAELERRAIARRLHPGAGGSRLRRGQRRVGRGGPRPAGRLGKPQRAIPRTSAACSRRPQPMAAWAAGPHRRLSPEQNAEASKACADLADEGRRDILPALKRVESAEQDRHLAGLKHMLKGEDRLKEKIADELTAKPGMTPRQALENVADPVRFTFMYSQRRYADGVHADIERLEAEGFELIKLKNLWADEQYKGINSQWRRPGNRSSV